MNVNQEVPQKIDPVINQAINQICNFDYDSLLEDVIVEKNILIANLIKENEKLSQELKELKKKTKNKV